MDKIFLGPGDDLETIQGKILSTKPRAMVNFEHGDYTLDRTLRFISGRAYISWGATFRLAEKWDGPMIEIVQCPDSEKSRIERMLSKKPILMKVLRWICHLLHIHLASDTIITGFCLDYSR